MKKGWLVSGGMALAAVCLTMFGCMHKKSISDANRWREETLELSEFDLLGVDPGAAASQAEIEQALAEKQHVTLSKGAAIMLIQSGADMPDEAMIKAMEPHFKPMLFSGDLNKKLSKDKKGNAAALRLIAAQGGCDKIVAYWGLLEATSKNLGSKGVSWLPLVGSVVPDKVQEMRIRLRAAVVDVKTGQWEMFATEPVVDKAFSAEHNRYSSDDSQTAKLKQKGYEALVKALCARAGG